jgi:hypothetical protein
MDALCLSFQARPYSIDCSKSSNSFAWRRLIPKSSDLLVIRLTSGRSGRGIKGSTERLAAQGGPSRSASLGVSHERREAAHADLTRKS